MATKIKIAELSIDNKKLLTELQATKKSLDELSETQKQLKKDGDTSSKTFIQNEADLKSLRAEYNSQVKVLQATTGANDKLNDALNREIKSVDEAKKNNAELKEIRNQLNASTDEGAKAIAEINVVMDANNEKINAGSSALEKQFQNVGNYPGKLGEVAGGLSSVTSGFGAMTKASLVFIATPIGALLAVLVGAFALVKNAMDRSEDSTNKITKGFSAFSGMASKLLGFLEPLGEFLIDGLVKGFESVETGLNSLLNGIEAGLRLLGFDESADSMANFNKEIKEGAENAKALAQAEADLQKEQRKAEKLQLDYQKNAEKLRQIRDDESKSTAERQKANEDLGLLLKQQSKDEIRIANIALAVADLRIKKEGETTEALDARGEALTKLAEIEERITSQESEQLVNQNSIRKEGADKAKEIANEKIAQKEAELELLKEQQRFEAKTDEERLAQQRVYADEELKILQDKLKNKELSETEYKLAKLKLEQDLTAEETRIKTENQEAEVARLKTFEDAKRTLINEIELAKEEDELARRAIQIERDYQDKQLELENLQLNAEEKLELEKLLIEQRNLELKELDTLKKEEDLLTEQEYEQRRKEIKEESFNAIASIFDAESNLGKAFLVAKQLLLAKELAIEASKTLSFGSQALARSTVAVAEGTAQTAKIGFPQNIPMLVGYAAQAVGIISAITSATKKKPKAERGMLLSGARHSSGGIHIEAEDGEAIINRNSTSKYLPLLSAINQDGGGVPFMARGGIAGTTSSSSANIIDYDLLAGSIANLPAPIVSVEEISSVSSRVNVIESNSIL